MSWTRDTSILSIPWGGNISLHEKNLWISWKSVQEPVTILPSLAEEVDFVQQLDRMLETLKRFGIVS